MDNPFPLRPNPSRAVEVFGEFNYELASKLLSQITELRRADKTPEDPITVYINSPGGNVDVLNFLAGALQTPDIDDKWCFCVTVASGMAASAGANLLAFGHYSYAYPHSYILFHSVRYSELPDKFETANQMVNEIQRINRNTSRKLAESIIPRVVHRYQRLKEQYNFKSKREKHVTELNDLRCFVEAVHARLSPRARPLIKKTYEQVKEACALSNKIVPKIDFGKRHNLAKDDSQVLSEVVKHELKEHKGKEWRLDDRGLNQIVNDYLIIFDYNLGDHKSVVQELLGVFGRDFLIPSDAKKYLKLQQKDEKKAFQFLAGKALPKLYPLWYFTVSLCRCLFQSENKLTAIDAYWLGVVDEVIGTKLTGSRIVAERSTVEALAKKNATSSPTAPQPPASQSAPAGEKKETQP